MWLYTRNTLGYSGVHTHHRTHITISKYTPRSSGVHTPHHRTNVTVPVLV